MILGLRDVTRHRFGAGTWTDGRFAPAVPVVETVQASPDYAPRGQWALDDDGNRTVRTIELMSFVDFREASTTHAADRVDIGDGRLYEVQEVAKEEPFEGFGEAHYEIRATEVRGSDGGTP